MKTLVNNHTNGDYTKQGWGAAILMGLKAFKFSYTAEIVVEDVECLPEFKLTMAGMKISETSLNSVWENEDEANWEQYLDK